ncbi:hypothetical protein GCM10010954_16200 [Halobacillus andaensis]|uniref:DUF3221 domain-containing protein n=1 Tax=Halobacillus andaensis TaxID=1176239 RepID=A0A917EWW8_HALAA|nr:hypothetical protein [Halobacillus andaensis]MBP2004878.1 hypothetical protein [Halobacillus andaensis]GGF18220.1 hypothetical protein GCM10010954_16200 [Halobacillus andaensis]
MASIRKAIVLFLFVISIVLVTYSIAYTRQQSGDITATTKGTPLEGKVEQKTTNGFILEVTAASKATFSDVMHVSYSGRHVLHKGDHVWVWYDEIRESDPPQTVAVEVEIKFRSEVDD